MSTPRSRVEAPIESTDIVETGESDADRIRSDPGQVSEDVGMPFTFYRGAAILQARTWRMRVRITGLACGDCHGKLRRLRLARTNAAVRYQRLRRDVSGPWMDIKRSGASLVRAARTDFSKTIAEEAVRAAAASYRERMAEFAEMTVPRRGMHESRLTCLKEHFEDPDMSARLSAKHNRPSRKTLRQSFPSSPRL